MSGASHFRLIGGLVVLLVCGGSAGAADFSKPNRVLRDGAIAYGNAQFDPETKLVRRTDAGHNALDVCQHSLEYAAALLDAGKQVDRANAVVAAVLDHQDLDRKSRTFGNFLWWHGETRVRDRNAVCFMSPWLSYVAMEHGKRLTADNDRRLREALRSGSAGAWERAGLYEHLAAEGRFAGDAGSGTR